MGLLVLHCQEDCDYFIKGKQLVTLIFPSFLIINDLFVKSIVISTYSKFPDQSGREKIYIDDEFI